MWIYLFGAAEEAQRLFLRKILQVDATSCHHVDSARPTAGLGVARVITSDPPRGKVPPPLFLHSNGTVRRLPCHKKVVETVLTSSP